MLVLRGATAAQNKERMEVLGDLRLVVGEVAEAIVFVGSPHAKVIDVLSSASMTSSEVVGAGLVLLERRSLLDGLADGGDEELSGNARRSRSRSGGAG